MHHLRTNSRKLFQVLHTTTNAQAAMMTLRPGQSSSDQVENEHPRCEQWLYVVKGTARATMNKRTIQLKANDLLLIEKGEPHKITNTGKAALVTLNLYAPPAYTDKGDVKTLAKIPAIRTAIGLK